MQIFYEAYGGWDKDKLDKIKRYLYPDSFHNFVRIVLITCLVLAFLLFIFKGYVLSLILIGGYLFIRIEYMVCLKGIVVTVMKGLTELNATGMDYSLFFHDDYITITGDPENESITLKYSAIKKIVENKDVLAIITNANLCFPIDLDSLKPDGKYEWLDFIVDRNKEIKLINIK